MRICTLAETPLRENEEQVLCEQPMSHGSVAFHKALYENAAILSHSSILFQTQGNIKWDILSLKGDHSVSTLFFVSETFVDISIVLVCEIMENTSMGFKYVYLLISISKYVFISSSPFYNMNYVF